MPTGRHGFTARDDAYVRESLIIEAGLNQALDDEPDERAEAQFQLNAAVLHARAERVAAAEGPKAARRLLLREVRRGVRWLRAVELGLAGDDARDRDARVTELRAILAQLMLMGALHGMQGDTATERLAIEAVTASALDPGTESRALAAQILSLCYRQQRRPELGLSVLLRAPTGEWAGRHLLFVLDSARRACAKGRLRRVAELMALTDWPCDPTGLVRELLRRLTGEQEPTPRELAARVHARRAAFAAGDWAALRELALSDVMWLEDDVTLWQALSGILRAYGAVEQARLAGDAAAELARSRRV
ncbi:hypothetical protein ABZV31_04470 [Streptomyces sp. NPDC005202]|uniref:hypothetical protein n=1 Tax=Streptomyces sp. NPDC005202 TaxID=3157021 RepID=UPI0033BCEA3C